MLQNVVCGMWYVWYIYCLFSYFKQWLCYKESKKNAWQSMIGRRIYSEKQKLSSYGIIGGIIFIVYQS